MKPLFVGEIKTKSPFNFISKYTKEELFYVCVDKIDWLSIHTHPDFGGNAHDISYFRKKTDKPILAKGYHQSNDEIQKCLDFGADYVLTVDFIPAEHLLGKTLLEFSTLADFESALQKYPAAKYVYNARNLKNGKSRLEGLYNYYRKANFLVQASFIKSTGDVKQDADAFIVGENLVEFCNQYI